MNYPSSHFALQGTLCEVPCSWGGRVRHYAWCALPLRGSLRLASSEVVGFCWPQVVARLMLNSRSIVSCSTVGFCSILATPKALWEHMGTLKHLPPSKGDAADANNGHIVDNPPPLRVFLECCITKSCGFHVFFVPVELTPSTRREER